MPTSRKFRFVSGMALLAGLGYPGAVLAQTADPAQPRATSAPEAQDDQGDGDIIVTGIRASLNSASAIKRNASSIVDAISAEDMGAFPDQNIAESLQRVTGIQIQRDRGEGRDISIRGLDPKFSRVLLNGDGLVSLAPITLLNPNGAPSPSRSFDFTTLSSDFVQTLVVSKSSTPDLEEGGLAGTVDVRTVKPLDLKKNRFSLTVEGLRNAYAKTVGPHISGAFSGKFFNDTLGIAIGADYSKRYMQTQSYQSSGQDSRQENQLKSQGITNVPFTNTGSLGTGINTSFVDWNRDGDNLDAYRFNHLVQFEQDIGKRERQTYNLGLQWRPTSKLEVNFDGIYSFYKTNFTNAAYTFQDHLGADPSVTGNRVVAANISSIRPFAGDVVGNGTAFPATCTTSTATPASCAFATSGSLLPISGLIDYYDLKGALVDNITKFNSSTSKTWQGQLGLIYRFSDNFRFDVQGSYVRSTRDNILNAGVDGFSYKEVIYDQRTDLSGVPTAAYGAGADPMNPATYNSGSTLFSGFVVPQKITQKMGSANLTWDDPLPWLRSLKVGYKYGSTTLSQSNYNMAVSAANFATLSGDTLTANSSSTLGLKANGITLTNYMTTFGGPDFLSAYGGASTFPRTWIGPDLAAILAKYPLSKLQSLPGALTATPATNTFRIQENTNAFYFRADFAWPDDSLSGNIGLRMVHTQSIANGFTGDPATLTQINASTLQYGSTTAPVRVVRNYWSALPSINLRYNASDKLTLRFAASQTVTRPDYGNMVPSNGLPSLVTGNATIANTALKPYYSINLDFGGEWYFAKDSVLSFALFKKYIRGYYVNQFNQISVTYRNLSGAPETRLFTSQQAVNGSDTTTQGVELALQLPFTFLPGPLSGFGTLLNYTYTDAGNISSGVVSGITTNFQVPFVSKHAANAVLYYEKYGFSARAAYVWRSKYTETPGGPGLDSRGGAYVKPAGYLDLSSKYQITPNFAVTLDAVNVLDTAVERVNIYGFGRGYEVNGRTITFGARLTF